MKRLIIIAGASGAGKSFLLQQMSEIDENIVPIKKLSTRSPRKYEEKPGAKIDLKFNCSIQQIKECQYKYRYEQNSYGILQEDIISTLNQNKMPFVIVRDCEEIIELKKDYPDALVLYLQSGLSGNDLAKILKLQGRDEIDIKTRDERSKKDHSQYVRHPQLFDYTLINYFESDSLIEHFKCILRIEKEKYSTERKFIFIIMSFSEAMKDIYEEMKFAAEIYDTDLKLERIDDNFGDYKITEAILSKIEAAEFIICDLTEEKPNVYFELGYARGINKTVVLTAKKGTQIHFDVNGYRVIFYSSPTELKKKLAKEFKYFYEK